MGPTGPVLCGFGASGPCRPGRQPDDDVVALARMVESLVPAGRVTDVARRVAATKAPARDAADAFRAAVSASLPGARRPSAQTALRDLVRPPARRAPARRTVVSSVVGCVAVVAVVAVVATLIVLAGASRTRSASQPVVLATPETTVTTEAPAVTIATQVWPSTSAVGLPAAMISVHGRRFAVGLPGDVAAPGPWGCQPASPVAALLRPATGQVYVFRQEASTGRDTTGAPVATVVGGRSLSSRDVDGDGCPDLLVERGAGTEPVTIDTGGAP
jgi:hypothetical protein